MRHSKNVKNQLTIRGLDAETEARLRGIAENRGISLNKAAILLMRKGAGVKHDQAGPEVVGHSLDAFIGSWTHEAEAEILQAVSDLNTLDETLWQ